MVVVRIQSCEFCGGDNLWRLLWNNQICVNCGDCEWRQRLWRFIVVVEVVAHSKG